LPRRRGKEKGHLGERLGKGEREKGTCEGKEGDVLYCEGRGGEGKGVLCLGCSGGEKRGKEEKTGRGSFLPFPHPIGEKGGKRGGCH